MIDENFEGYADSFILSQRAYWLRIINSGQERDRHIIRSRFDAFETERARRGLPLEPATLKGDQHENQA